MSIEYKKHAKIEKYCVWKGSVVMAGVRFEKNSPEWKMFNEYWKICQKYWLPEDSDAYWQSLTDETVAFGEKYDKVSKGFSIKISLALLDELQEKHRDVKDRSE